jgi:hypothetical protein
MKTFSEKPFEIVTLYYSYPKGKLGTAVKKYGVIYCNFAVTVKFYAVKSYITLALETYTIKFYTALMNSLSW